MSEGISKGWVQFLLVAVPVMSLVGSWLALRGVTRRGARKEKRDGTEHG